jgi:hypothetical protein
MVSVQVLEDAVLVFQSSIHPLWWCIIDRGEGPLLCALGSRGGDGQASGSGQGAVGGLAEGRGRGCVSCEHGEMLQLSVWCVTGAIDARAASERRLSWVLVAVVRFAMFRESMTRAFCAGADWPRKIVDIKSV